MADKKICPLVWAAAKPDSGKKTTCLEGGCAWWVNVVGCCSVTALAGNAAKALNTPSKS